MSGVQLVAIVGMAVLLPGAPDLDTYWHNIANGVDAISDLPPARWSGQLPDEVYCRRGGFVDELVEFDATRFGIMPSSVRGTEPDQLIALRVADAAVADAGGDLGDRDRVGIILGRGGYLTPGIARLDQQVRTAHQLVHTLAELVPGLGAEQLARVREAFTGALGPDQPDAAIGLVPNLAASRIANRLDLHGPAYTVDAACASSLVAVDQAISELASGRCDVMLAGGVHHCHDVTFWSVFSRLRALSTSQQIRPFDRRADGLLIGEGTGVVVLKRLADAQRDGNRIYAIIRGSAVSSDGRGASLVNPATEGQTLAVRRAWDAAGLDPAAPGSIGLLEAHGTATPAGDQAELATLRSVFGAGSGKRAVIGSVKSMIGHTMPAAGIAALVKAALSVYHGVLPPTLHCDDPNPELARTRFETIATARPWTDRVRRAGVNAFGFGGINAHVVIEQAGAPVAVEVTESEQVLRLAANSPAELLAMLDEPGARSLVGRYRLGIVAPSEKKLATARRVVGRNRVWRGRGDIWFSPDPLLEDPRAKVAFVFPGLEAEFAPLVADVAEHFALPLPDLSAAELGRHGAGVIAVGRLLDAALREIGIVPDAVAGHSVGEWTALVAAGVHAPAEVDELMASFDLGSMRVPGLEFAVIGCGADQVHSAIADRPDLVVSHENSTNQTVVCGPAAAVAELTAHFRAMAVICQVLPFRSGFHTPMLRPYIGPFQAAADSLGVYPPAVPVWSATTAAEFPTEPARVRDLYVRHLLEPVRFRSLVENMYLAGVRAFVTMGPGQLGSLIDDTLGAADHLTVAANSAHRGGLGQLRRVATALWVEGAEPRFDAFTRPGTRLDLSAGLVSLGPAASTLMPATRRTRVDELAARIPEFALLLTETEAAAAAVLDALTPPPSTTTTLRVSTETMPYLLDHCFAEQRPGWPDETDRRPVVPATTMVRHMVDAAEKAVPGRRAVGVIDVRFDRWLVAAPAVDVEVTAELRGDQVSVVLGEYASAVVLMAEQFPLPTLPSWPWVPWQAPTLTAEQIYTERWMFHGPRFQGITALQDFGKRHVRGEITAPTAPGALLDNVGQLFGHWIVETQPHRRVAFPIGIDRITFFDEEPPPGSTLDCDIRVTSTSDDEFAFDARLTRDDRVWADISGWRDRRFDSHPQQTEPAYRQPQRNTLARRRPGGWYVVAERWADLASRELFLHKYLNAAERAQYQQLTPTERRHWLLGRIAIKDAVRDQLWAAGAGDVFPAEILVLDEDGRPTVRGLHGRELPPLDVAVAHCRELAVAVIGDRPWIRIVEDTGATPSGPHTRISNPPDLPDRHYIVTHGKGVIR